MGDSMQNDRRTFHIFDLELATKKEGASPPTMMEALRAWDHRRQAGATYPVQNGDKTMLLGGVHIFEETQSAVLLVRLSDKKAPNSVYSDPEADVFNEHIKEGNVGADYACHVLVSTAAEQAQANVYTCAVERVPGIPYQLVGRLLSKLLNLEYHANNNFYKYLAPGGGLDKSGNPRMLRCCPHVELRGRPSSSLIDDINEGRLSGVTLVRTEQVAPIAGAPYLVKSRSELKLTINHDGVPAQVWNSLQHALQQNSGAYGRAKVSYRAPNSRRTVTVELDSQTGTPLSDLYIQAFDIAPIFPPLAQSTNAIVTRLVDPARQQLLQIRSI